MKKAISIVFIVLLIDQAVKIYIKTHFVLHESVAVFGWDWFQINFVQNNGMAWGTEIGGRLGKLLLTLFRIVAVTGIAYWLHTAIKEKRPQVLIFAISLILAGAIGNIIDSMFYGLIFDNPVHKVATLFPEHPYDTFLHGKVVDMFYFPIIQNAHLPDWIPFIGGNNFTFFNAIFNVADAAITIGVFLLIIFNKKAFKKSSETSLESDEAIDDTITEKPRF